MMTRIFDLTKQSPEEIVAELAYMCVVAAETGKLNMSEEQITASRLVQDHLERAYAIAMKHDLVVADEISDAVNSNRGALE